MAEYKLNSSSSSLEPKEVSPFISLTHFKCHVFVKFALTDKYKKTLSILMNHNVMLIKHKYHEILISR